MTFLVIGAVLAVCAVWIVVRGLFFSAPKGDEGPGVIYSIETSVRAVDAGESKPDNPKYATWDEAMNRPITDELRFRITYVDTNGEVTERNIRPKMIHLIRQSPEVRITAYCYLRNEERTFNSSRIETAYNLKTGRAIMDLGQYLRQKY